MTASTARRGRPRDASIDIAILTATIDEIIERGRGELSMEAIALRAGVAKTTLYRRFENLDDLVYAAMRTFEAEAQVPPPGPVREQLIWLVDLMRRKWSDPRYAAMMRRVSADGTANPERYRRTRDRLVGPHVRRLDDVLARGIAEGSIRDDVDLVWARQLLVSPIVAATAGHRPRLGAAQVEFNVDTVLRGLAP